MSTQAKSKAVKLNTAVMHLLENNLPFINDNFEDINYGGCGVMAVLIGEQLDKLGVRYCIACLGYSDWMTVEEVQEAIKDGRTRDIPNVHILINITDSHSDRFFDSDGEQDIDSEQVAALIDIQTLNNMLQMPRCWNSDFNRDQTEGMREYTNELFNTLRA